MKRINQYLTATLVFASLCTPAFADDKTPQAINAVITDPANFEVIFNRANPTGAGGAIAGIVGAAIQRGAQSSEDSSMADKVKAVNPDLACDKPLLDGLNATLQSNGAYQLKDSAGDGVEKVQIEMWDCGLQLADSGTKQLSAYVQLKFKVQPLAGEGWSEYVQISGRQLYSFDELSKQQGLATTTLSDVLHRAGVRIAQKIIYKH